MFLGIWHLADEEYSRLVALVAFKTKINITTLVRASKMKLAIDDLPNCRLWCPTCKVFFPDQELLEPTMSRGFFVTSAGNPSV